MVVATLALLLWAQYTRLVRGQVLSVKERDFVALAHVAGSSTFPTSSTVSWYWPRCRSAGVRPVSKKYTRSRLRHTVVAACNVVI